MRISLLVRAKESCLKVAEYLYHYVFMTRKVFESCGIRISLLVDAKNSV